MKQTWKIMRELSKPFKGFEYECPDGHTWQIKREDWDARGENNCPDCAAVTAEVIPFVSETI